MNRFSLNLFFPIFIAVGIWLCTTGRVSWWVFLLVGLSCLQANIGFNKRP